MSGADPRRVLLECTGIAKRFGGLEVLSGIDLQTYEHECLAIIGPNGAGKTTFFNILTGLLRPSAGRVVFDGVDITREPPHRRAGRGISRTMQVTSVFGELSVLENVMIGVQCRHRPWKIIRGRGPDDAAIGAEARRLLALVGLDKLVEAPAQELAHGDQRLLEIAITLSTTTRLLLLDEPTAGLSPAETHEVTRLLHDLWKSEALTMILVEHDMEVAVSLASRIAVLDQGRCIAVGDPQTVMADEAVNRVYLKGHQRASA